MNATETKTGASQQAVNNNKGQTENQGPVTQKRFYIPAGTGMCVLTLHLRPELIEQPQAPAVVAGGTPSESQAVDTTKRHRRKTTQKLMRVLLSDGKPVDGREATGSLKVVYLPKGEVYNQKKHGPGVRYNRFFHKPMKSIPLSVED